MASRSGLPCGHGSGALVFELCHPCRWHVFCVAAARPLRQEYGNQALKKKILINIEKDSPSEEPPSRSLAARCRDLLCVKQHVSVAPDSQRLVPALDARSNIVLAGHGLGRFFGE